ncbi:hypothetical protein shim_21200 [Shimia sp. SK013]|uniref:hypothetical protein n=1 Tax=Shimia sp. SK013 TaxID=1389006 RepID=UPI0006B4EBC8|nr:hypothetical protein [Shimia sp. SK013]KPA21416.1 hypothetical protein shim_21200 [Shimia sp. SK013]
MIDKHLILHVGPPKTGSSAIQRALFETQQTGEATYCYPEVGLSKRWHSHDVLIRTIRENGGDSEARARMFGEVAEIASQSPHDRVILSDEYLGGSNLRAAEMLPTCLPKFREVTIVYVVRSIYEMGFSALNQRMRRKVTMFCTPDPYLSANNHKKRAVALTALRNGFDNANIAFIVYNRDLVSTFFDRFAGMAYAPQSSGKSVNKSLDFGTLLALQMPQKTKHALRPLEFETMLRERDIEPLNVDSMLRDYYYGQIDSVAAKVPAIYKDIFSQEAVDELIRRPTVPEARNISKNELSDYLSELEATIAAYRKAVCGD